mmetsp:Transcript_29451/g.64724  ORF Transcript_29451/g.64724 Transcript_29451/m.64724 type:complete len:213 (-) Transcript_29451:1579-2217(-)
MPLSEPLHFRHRLSGHGLRPKGRLLDLGLTLNTVSIHASLRLCDSGTTRLHSASLGLALQQLLLLSLRPDLILQLLPHQLASILLVHPIAIIPRGHLLGLCSDLDSLLHRLEQRISGLRIRRLDALHIDGRNHQIISWESQLGSHLPRLRPPKDSRLNNISTVLVELVKSCGRDTSTDTRRDGHAHVADKIPNGKKLGRLRFVRHIKIPIVS